tara:strand:+ start:3342 stop:3602 length:261 start_codon:yes stop_codon:yes gene_type:complete
MKFLIVAIMAFSYMNGDKPIFVFTHENFDTAEQCVEHVQSNSQSLMYKLMAEFPNQKLDRILCVPEENVNKILQMSTPIQDEGHKI